MAKTNIVFNNTNYSIDDSSLSSAVAELRSHLSTVMNGSGATINFGGTAYNVDSAKLSAATNEFVSHLGTIAGSGHKVTVNGVEYGIDSAKVAGAISELESVFSGVGEERLDGDGAEYYTLAPTALSFRSTAPLNELQEVQINGVTVDPSNYTLEEGSTIVTFPIEYLKTLDVGSYEVAVASDSKSVKGRFTVAAPELNNHGFYYNQPYTANVPYLGGQTVFFLCESGQMNVIILDNGYVETCSYVADGNNLTINAAAGTFTGTANANNIYCNELATTFVLGDESIAADEDYIYKHNSTFDYYYVEVIDKTKSTYKPIRTGINGMPTSDITDTFRDCINLISLPSIPDDVSIISPRAFCGCINLTTINIPNNITYIDTAAFNSCSNLSNVVISEGVTGISGMAFTGCYKLRSITIPVSMLNIARDALPCQNLTDIKYNGSKAQWNSINKSDRWDGNADNYVIHCTDGDITKN